MAVNCPHPLLNDLVLEKIFINLPLGTLKECRQVCKKWEEISNPMLREQSQIRLHKDIHRNKFFEKFLRRDSHFLMPSKLKLDISFVEFDQMDDEYSETGSETESDNEISIESLMFVEFYEELHGGLEDISKHLRQHPTKQVQFILGDKFLQKLISNSDVPNLSNPIARILWQLKDKNYHNACFNSIYSRDPKWVENHHKELYDGLEKIKRILRQHCITELDIDISNRFSNYPAGRLFKILNHLSPTLKSLEILSLPGLLLPIGRSESYPLEILPLTSISVNGFHLKEMKEASFWFLEKIFSSCPNLKEVSVLGNVNFKFLADMVKFRGITQLDLPDCKLGKEEWEILKRECGNLEILCTRIRKNTEDSLMDFLKCQGNSLKNLQLQLRNPSDLMGTVGFPLLTKLSLELPYCQEFTLDICFSRDTPQLKYLQMKLENPTFLLFLKPYFSKNEIENGNYIYRRDWKDFFGYRKHRIGVRNGIMPLPTLTHLDLVDIMTVDDPECADYLGKLFPSLTSLKLKEPTPEFLRGVWQSKELAQSLLKIEIKLYENNRFGDRDREILDSLGKVLFGNQENEKSLLNMIHLRYFCIDTNAYKGAFGISDAAVGRGFARMRKLAVLKLRHIEVAPETKKYLQKYLPYLRTCMFSGDEDTG